MLKASTIHLSIVCHPVQGCGGRSSSQHALGERHAGRLPVYRRANTYRQTNRFTPTGNFLHLTRMSFNCGRTPEQKTPEDNTCTENTQTARLMLKQNKTNCHAVNSASASVTRKPGATFLYTKHEQNVWIC